MKTLVRHSASRRAGAFALAAAMPLTTAIVLGTAPAAATPAQPGGCPDLMMYGIQGTGQSSPDADPGVDTGFLGTVLSAALQEAQGTVERAYIPYAGSFGGTGPSTPGQNASYMDSVMGAVATGEQWITDKVAECPDIHIGLAGFSQGAHAVRLLMQAILDGKLPIDPSQVALVANFGDPTRPAGASIFPDAPGQTTPDPVPGTSGAMVRQLMTTALSPEGGGIGPTADIAAEIGELAGRYFSMCSSGDMTCDSPASAPLAHTVANIAGQLTLDPGDPIKSAETIAKALAFTTIKTIVPVINEDLQGTTLQNLSYRPEVSIGQRLAAASDPRTPLPNISDAVNALFKIGTIGLNAAITVGKQLLAPDTIAAIAAAGATNPVAILGIVGAKLGQAAITLVPPSTANRLVKEAFTTFKTNFTENADLLSVTSLMKYWDSASAHNSYGLDSVTPSGDPSTSFVAKWIAAAGMDIAGISDGGTAATTEVGTPPAFDIPTDGTTTAPVEGEMGQLGALTGLLPGVDSTVVAESSTPSVSAEPPPTEAPYTPN